MRPACSCTALCLEDLLDFRGETFGVLALRRFRFFLPREMTKQVFLTLIVLLHFIGPPCTDMASSCRLRLTITTHHVRLGRICKVLGSAYTTGGAIELERTGRMDMGTTAMQA